MPVVVCSWLTSSPRASSTGPAGAGRGRRGVGARSAAASVRGGAVGRRGGLGRDGAGRGGPRAGRGGAGGAAAATGTASETRRSTSSSHGWVSARPADEAGRRRPRHRRAGRGGGGGPRGQPARAAAVGGASRTQVSPVRHTPPAAPAGGPARGLRGPVPRPAGRLAERWTCVRGPTYSSNTRSSEQAFEHRLREAIVRRYDEPVQVRLSEGPEGTHGGGGPVPGRVPLAQPALRGARGAGLLAGARGLVGAARLGRAAGRRPSGRSGGSRPGPAGRSAPGVYDLAQAVPAGVPAMAGGPGAGAGAGAASRPGGVVVAVPPRLMEAPAGPVAATGSSRPGPGRTRGRPRVGTRSAQRPDDLVLRRRARRRGGQRRGRRPARALAGGAAGGGVRAGRPVPVGRGAPGRAAGGHGRARRPRPPRPGALPARAACGRCCPGSPPS